MEYKEEYICGSKKLENLLDNNTRLFILSAIIFIVGLFIDINEVFFICLIGILISFFIFITIEPEGEDAKAILDNFIKTARISQNILLFFLFITFSLICYGLLMGPFNIGCVFGCIFFVINIMFFFNFNNISKVSKDVIEKLEYKERVR